MSVAIYYFFDGDTRLLLAHPVASKPRSCDLESDGVEVVFVHP